MKSIMSAQHNFATLPSADVPRSSFNRSHGYKTTFNAGKLVPIFVDEALPADTHSLSLNSMCRMVSPLTVPIMDNMYLDFFFFSVPVRLVWENFKAFMGERSDADVAPSHTVPTITGTNVAAATLWDYFGLPVEMTDSIAVNSLPFRCYNLIWNEWFKSQSLQDDVTVDTDDGADTFGDYSLLDRCKRHDYITSSLPWTQKGTEVTTSLSGSADVMPTATEHTTSGSSTIVWRHSGTGALPAGNYGIAVGTAGNMGPNTSDTLSPTYPIYPTNLYADLTGVTAVTINDLREAFQTQKFLEKQARSGSRYTETVQAFFGVKSPDSRLQRPEYLGGGSRMINVTPVTQTSESNTTKQGTQAGHVVSASGEVGFTASFTEHSYIIGLVNVRADLTYQNCVNKMWSRSTIYDFYWPTFAHIGEQPVLNKEVYWDDGAGVEDNTFGYQEAWADYRYKPSQITGLLRSEATSNIDEWHLSQDFGGTMPTLGDTFIKETPPMSRVKAVASAPDFILDVFFNLNSVRAMPVYSVPGLIDHF